MNNKKSIDSRSYEAMREDNPSLPEWSDYLLKTIAEQIEESQEKTEKILKTNQ